MTPPYGTSLNYNEILVNQHCQNERKQTGKQQNEIVLNVFVFKTA